VEAISDLSFYQINGVSAQDDRNYIELIGIPIGLG
jgi:hypothetical protein